MESTFTPEPAEVILTLSTPKHEKYPRIVRHTDFDSWSNLLVSVRQQSNIFGSPIKVAIFVLIVPTASFAQSPFLEIQVFVHVGGVTHMMAAMMTMTMKMILRYNINFKILSIVCNGMHVLSAELGIM